MDKAELVKKFLANNCTEEEAKLAMQYLDAEPSLLDEFLPDAEWEAADTSLPIAPSIETDMRRHVKGKTVRPVRRLVRPVLASAAIVSALLIGLFFLMDPRQKVVQNELAAATPALSIKKIENNTSSVRHITLSDRSSVTIYPGSSIEYPVNFTANRTIKLNGKATFHVTRNEGSPFVVYSGQIRTTALGTRFLVNNTGDVTRVNVKLFEGRVVVQPVDSNMHIYATFLEAGQQCFVDITNRLVSVKPIFTQAYIARAEKQPVLKKESSIQHSNLLTFSKTPLPEVLEQLQRIYKQPITFDAADIHEKYFTGSFSLDDSLSTVLKMIVAMNELEMNTGSGSIEISKATPVAEQISAGSAVDSISAGYARPSPNKIDLWKNTPGPKPLAGIASPQPAQEKIMFEEDATRYTRISLSDLLQRLQKQTNKKIYYNEEELKHINFTGTVPFDESIRNLLTVICNSNGLTLTVKKGAYYINKRQN